MCCLFGLLDPQNHLSGRQKAKVIRSLSLEAEVRGTDACGIAYNSHGALHIYKRPGPASQTRFFIPNDARVIMGHTRMTTQGNAKFPQNNHPFPGKAGGMRFALAHNGVLYNDKSLRRSRHLPKTNIQTDSYVAVQLLEQLGALTPDSLKEMAETVEGSFVFTVLDEKNNLYFVKGDNPLCLMYLPRPKLYIYASTQEILKRGLKQSLLRELPMVEVPVKSGEILRVTPTGTKQWARFSWITHHFTGRMQGWLACGYASHALEPQYLQQLKGVAAALGYSSDEIDNLLAEGWTTDDIEEMIYCS